MNIWVVYSHWFIIFSAFDGLGALVRVVHAEPERLLRNEERDGTGQREEVHRHAVGSPANQTDDYE